MLPQTIIFLGSKPIGYECLSWLIAQQQTLNVTIAGILTQNRTEFGNAHNLGELASQHGIPVIANLNDIPECDVLYSVQYHQILKAEHIAKARHIAVNLHMAPLPEYRGSNQFSFALLEGKTEFGTTVHVMDSRIDHGDILFQKRFPIPENCWVDDLYKLTYNASMHLFRQTFSHILSGNFKRLPQQSLVPRYGTSLHMRSEMQALKEINLQWPPEQIDRHIRATSMPGFEPPYCIVGGQKVYFSRTWQHANP